MIKRMLALCMVLVMLLSMMPAAFAENLPEEELPEEPAVTEEPSQTEAPASEPPLTRELWTTNVTVHCQFLADSVLGAEDELTGAFTLNIHDGENGPIVQSSTVSRENDFTAVFSLPEGVYQAKLSGAYREGYIGNQAKTLIYVFDGVEYGDTVVHTLKYIYDEADVSVSIKTGDGSQISQDYLYGVYLDFISTENPDEVYSWTLDEYNNHEVSGSLPSGTYDVSITTSYPSYFTVNCDAPRQLSFSAGESYSYNWTIELNDYTERVPVKVSFVGSGELPNSYVENYEVVAYNSAGQIVDRGELWYDEDEDGDVFYSITLTLEPGEYTVELLNAELPGYRLLTGADELKKTVTVIEGEGGRVDYRLNYIRPEAELKITLDFAGDSLYAGSQIGDIELLVEDANTYESRRVILSQANGRSVSLELPIGEYILKFRNTEMPGCVCGLEGSFSYTLNEEGLDEHIPVRYETTYAQVEVRVEFAEDSALKAGDVNGMDVVFYKEDGYDPDGITYARRLDPSNNFTALALVPAGSYNVSLDDYEEAGYEVEFERMNFGYFEKGKVYTEVITLKYVEDKAGLDLQLVFAEDSALKAEDVGEIGLSLKNYEFSRLVYETTLSGENDYRSFYEGISGSYELLFSGYEVEGYRCSLEYVDSVYLPVGQVEEWVVEVRYVEDVCDFELELYFESDSPVSAAELGDITADFYLEDEKTGEYEYVNSMCLSKSDDDYSRKASARIPTGTYRIEFSGHDKDGYMCSLDTPVTAWVYAEETQHSETVYVNYYACGVLRVELNFAEDNELDPADIEQIAVNVSCYSDYWYDEWIYLNEESGWSFELKLQPYQHSIWIEAAIPGYKYVGETVEAVTVCVGETVEKEFEIKFISSPSRVNINLEFDENSPIQEPQAGEIVALLSDGEGKELRVPLQTDGDGRSASFIYPGYQMYLVLQDEGTEGYMAFFDGAEYGYSITPGEDLNINGTVMYAEAKNRVNVKVSFSEESDKSARIMRDRMWMSVDCYGGEWDFSKFVYHNGSNEFSYSFDALPDDYYCFAFQILEIDKLVSVESFKCSVPCEAAGNGRELFFPLEGGSSVDVEIVLKAQNTYQQVNVVGRFHEDSALKAEDFPEGLDISVIGSGKETEGTGREGYNDFSWPIANISAENNWTYTFQSHADYWPVVALAEPVPGYDCIVHLQDEAGNRLRQISLKFPEVTVYAWFEFVPYVRYVDVDMSFAADSALSEADAGEIGLEISYGNRSYTTWFSSEKGWKQPVEIYGDYTGDLSYSLLETARDGYSYSYDAQLQERIVNYDDIFNENGERLKLSIEHCYKAEPGTLNVYITASPLGIVQETTVYVKDSEGRLVASAEANETNGYSCSFELEAGEYTVSQDVKESYTPTIGSGDMFYFADGPVSFDFDPESGKSISLLNEGRQPARLKLDALFAAGSCLSERDFEEGIRVIVSGEGFVYSGSFTLSEENGWTVDTVVPEGLYTAEVSCAELEGFERETRIVSNYYLTGQYAPPGDGGARAGGSEDSSAGTAVVGGPYYVRSERSTEYSYSLIRVISNYIEEPKFNSITVTNRVNSALFGGAPLSQQPDTGFEAAEYSYSFTCGGLEETLIMAPGESLVLENLPVGAEYSLTAAAPTDCAWNIPVMSFTGTVPAPEEDSAEIVIDNDYLYSYAEPVSIKLLKIQKGGAKALAGAEFGLFVDAACTQLVSSAVSDENGLLSFSFTEAGTWYLKEQKAPKGYKLSDTVYPITVSEEWVKDVREENGEEVKVIVQQFSVVVAGLADEGGYLYGIENEPLPPVTVTVTKKFKNDEKLERPDFVEITLYQDGKPIAGVKLSEENNWTHKWTDLPAGHEYTVDERVPKGYVRLISRNGNDFVVTNVASYPATGDNAELLPWAFMAMLSLCGAAMLIRKLRREEQ